jgi:hypothetical protein
VDFMRSLTNDVFEIALNDDNNSFPRTAKISKNIVYIWYILGYRKCLCVYIQIGI